MARRFLALGALSLVLASCAMSSTTTVTVTTTTQEAQSAPAESEACQATMQPSLDALQELDSRLDVGLTLDAYEEALARANVLFEQIDTVALSALGECVDKVHVPAHLALNDYVKAQRLWSECIQDPSCKDADRGARLHPLWSRTASNIQRARFNLELLQE
jgi:hypothetical protein